MSTEGVVVVLFCFKLVRCFVKQSNRRVSASTGMFGKHEATQSPEICRMFRTSLLKTCTLMHCLM